MNEAVSAVVLSSEEGVAKLDRVLVQARNCLSEFSQDHSEELTKLDELQQRLASGTFRLAVLGQFKRGKSTLLNALLGSELLPTDILPVTAIPTYIKASEALSVAVYFMAGDKDPERFDSRGECSLSEFLNKYITEAGNPHNQLGVQRVEIGHPATLLKQGVVLVDTPGVGSTHQHNTDVAYQVLPQCDAALFLVSPDPPITAAELSYLTDIKQQLPRTFFVLNKIDNLDEDERIASLNFLAEQLTPLCQAAPQIIPVSARNGLKARIAGDDSGWKQSGMYQVESSLTLFFAAEKKQVLMTSLRCRLVDQLQNILLRLTLSLQAVQLPEDELKKKISQFSKALPAIERELLATEDILAGDHDRIVAVLNQAVDGVRSQAKGAILEPIENYLASIEDSEEMERVCRDLLETKIPIVFSPAMQATVNHVHKEALILLEIHQRRCDELIEQVRRIAAEVFAIPYHAPQAGQAIIRFNIPGWSSDLFISDMDPFGQKLSRKFFTKKYRHKKTVQRLRQETLKLIGMNVEQIAWALRKGLDESFRKYKVQLHEELNKTIQATRQAMEVAVNKNDQLASENDDLEQKLNSAILLFKGLTNDLTN